MWAGGSIAFSNEPLSFFDEAVLRERVESVQVKGDRLFVWFERNMFRVPEGVGEPAVAERRCLVFFPQGNHTPATQILRPRSEPDFCETFTPTGHLLMRFSALTFNAHRIHYDSVFSKEEEGYRNNLCHGPLAVVFLLGLLRRELPDKRVKSFEYKCLAPMYVDERYKIAGKERGDGKVELWAETPEGGLSVRGVAEVEDVKVGI
jgi:hydroxyacyl-ACP dehydratase HTD2-like protein with hotdog domain